jgi:succinoglycan biosynthesis transport protein ExoP
MKNDGELGMRTSGRVPSGRRVLELADLLGTERQDWTLSDLMTVLRRRRRYLLGCVGGALLLATAYSLVATPRFQATGEIEVQKESPAAFGLENTVTGDAASAGTDSLDYSMTLETEAKILQSNTLALQVIKDLKLESTHDYFPVRSPGFQIPGWVCVWRKPVEPLRVNLADAPNRRYVALKVFDRHLKVLPETGTRLIEVSYSDPDPELAAAVVNKLIQSLTDYTYQARFHATAQASSWLADQLADLRQQTKVLQDKANRLQRDTGIYGEDASHDVVLQRLDALNGTLAAAESNRLLKEAIYRISQSGDPELISGLAGNSTVGGTPALNNSLALIQTLRGQEAAVRAEIAESDARYGAAHPRVAELQSELDGIERSIHEEVARIGERSRTDFEIAQAAESSARDSFEKQKELANNVSGKAVAYQLARQDADGSRGVYQGLLAKLREAGVLEGLRSTNLTVVNPGRVPPTHRPKSPNVPLCYAAALIGGLFLGCAGAVASELSDHTVRSLDGLERMTGLQLLGVLPQLRPAAGWRPMLAFRGEAGATKDDPLFLPREGSDAPFLESLRSLRTSLLLLRSGRRSQVVLVTSSVAGEGKSKVAVNLAGVLAQLGARVLLVDADLRRPSVHEELKMSSGGERSRGLGEALIGEGAPAIMGYEALNNLSVLCGSATAPMPAELLASQRMADLLRGWRDDYDFVVLDSPPVLPATDALVLAQMSDITLLIARHGFTPKQAIHRSFAILNDQIPETCLVRVVLNSVHPESYDFHEYYGYKWGDSAQSSGRRLQ